MARTTAATKTATPSRALMRKQPVEVEKNMTLLMPKKTWLQLRQLAGEQDRSMKAVVLEGLAMVFAKHKR